MRCTDRVNFASIGLNTTVAEQIRQIAANFLGGRAGAVEPPTEGHSLGHDGFRAHLYSEIH